MRHANDFNGFTLEILACPDAIRSLLSPTDAAYIMVAAKVPVNEMARQLGRHRSTIYREIKRNTFHDRQWLMTGSK